MALSAILVKGFRLFFNRSTRNPQSTTNVPPSSPATTPPKKFEKSNDAGRDISVLAMTYILQDNSTIQELIRLIISLHDRDDNEVCATYNPCQLTVSGRRRYS